MADDMQEKTEEATPKKREDALKEGKVAKTQELGNAMVMLGAALLLSMVTASIGREVGNLFVESTFWIRETSLDVQQAAALINEIAMRGLLVILPLLVGIAVVGAGMTLIQTKGLISLSALRPKFDKINPVNGLKNMLGIKGLVNLLKQSAKLLIISLVGVWVLWANWSQLLSMLGSHPTVAFETMRVVVVSLMTKMGVAYLAIAAADYLYQKWDHEQNLMMSKEEVKQEYKNSEGDPLIKQRIRQIARARAKARMMQAVPQGDVVIRNPTHRAVVLKYDPEVNSAPYVIAMGERKVAERIIEIAAAHNVPMVEDRVLAKALIATAKLNAPIPVELFIAVAEILAHVYRIRSGTATYAPRKKNYDK